MDKSEYHKYLASREWALLKGKVRARSSGRCERCLVGNHDSTHHLTYERIGKEELGDLQAVCSDCHGFLSGKSDFDPAKTVAENVASGIEALCFLATNTDFLHRVVSALGRQDLVRALDEMNDIWELRLDQGIQEELFAFLSEHIELYKDAKDSFDLHSARA